jgi:hypothetical protein
MEGPISLRQLGHDADAIIETAFRAKLRERRALSWRSMGMLLVMTGSQHALECSLCAALLRAQHAAPLIPITGMTDKVAAATLASYRLVPLFDTVQSVPLEVGFEGKLQALLRTPFNFSLFLDCDVATMVPTAPRDMLRLVAAGDADLVATPDWASSGTKPLQPQPEDVFSHGRPMLCTAILAFANVSAAPHYP